MGRKYLHLMQHQVYTWSNRSKYRHWSLWAIEERDRNVTLIGMIYKTFSREKCEEIQIPFCICSYSLLVFMFFLQTPSYKCKLLQKQCQQSLYWAEVLDWHLKVQYSHLFITSTTSLTYLFIYLFTLTYHNKFCDRKNPASQICC